MPTINELKKKALNDAGFSGSISDAESKWLKDVCDPYKGSIPDMWRYALKEAGYTGFLVDMQKAMLSDLGHTGALPNQWYKYWRDTPLEGIGEGGVGLPVPDANWDSPPEDNTPQLSVNVPDGVLVEGDDYVWWFDTVNTFDGVDFFEVSGTVNSVDAIDGEISETITALTNVTWYAKFKVTDKTEWSNIINQTIAAAPPSEASYTFGGIFDLADADQPSATVSASVDLGTAEAGRYVLAIVNKFAETTDPVTATAAGVSLGSPIGSFTDGLGTSTVYLAEVATGAGSQTVSFTYGDGASYFSRGFAVWVLRDLASFVPKDMYHAVSPNDSQGTFLLDVVEGDFVFVLQQSGDNREWNSGATDPVAHDGYIKSSSRSFNSADWTVETTTNSFNLGNPFPGGSVAIVFSGD